MSDLLETGAAATPHCVAIATRQQAAGTSGDRVVAGTSSQGVGDTHVEAARRKAGLMIATLFLLALTAGAGNARELVAPRADESLLLRASATGVQIYQCRSSAGNGARHEWMFVAPQAQLHDERRRAIGRHGAGPLWEATDGSQVVGAVERRTDAPLADSIPWLRFSARAQGPQGRFSRVTSILRINTVGGMAPATNCTPEAAGSFARVPYVADYLFFAERSDRARLSAAY